MAELAVDFLPRGDQIAGQAKSFVVAAIDVANEFVDIRMITFGGQLDRLFKRAAAGEETT